MVSKKHIIVSKITESEVRRDERCREKRKNQKHSRNANAARREKLTNCRKWSGIVTNKAGNGREKSGLGRRRQDDKVRLVNLRESQNPG